MARALKNSPPENGAGHSSALGIVSASRVDAAVIRNPVLQMQQDLEALWPPAPEIRWSARRTLGFLLATNGLFWVALVLGLRSLA